MIVFVPAYDEATEENLNIAKNLEFIDNSKILFKDKATKENLISELQINQSMPIFAMSHGDTDKLSVNNSNNPINLDDVSYFINRKSFIFACKTGDNNGIGKKVSENNGIWFGYTGTITPPNNNCTNEFKKVFKFIIDNFSKYDDTKYVNFIDELKILCDSIKEDEINLDYDNIISIYSCFNNISDRLRIWKPNNILPFKATHIGEENLFYYD